MNLLSIARGWYLYLNGSPQTRTLLEQRLAICQDCPEKVALSPLGQILTGLLLDETTSFKCKSCGCFLEAAAAEPKKKCPLNRWPAP